MSGGFDNTFFRQAQEHAARQLGHRNVRLLEGGALTNADTSIDPDTGVATPDALVAGRDLDRERREVVVPSYAGHPCPEAAQFLWIMARETGTAPPWRVRVHARLFAKYNGILLIAQALAPHAQVIMTPDGRRPLPPLDGTRAIEFNWHDQPAGTGGRPSVHGGDLILPSGVERSKRTT